MKILVIHQVPYRKMSYHLGLDHDRHEVTYIGHPQRMADLPAELRCRRIELAEGEDLVEGVTARVSPEDGFEKLLSLSEFGILQAWHIRRHLGLAGPSLEQIERVRDKVSMKQALADSGIRHPRFEPAPAPCDALPWTGRTVIKPRQGASSEGVTLHDTAREALTAYWKLDDRLDFQLEEYIDGDILHIDGLVSDGTPGDLVISRYINKPVEYLDGHVIASHQIPDPHGRFRHFAEQVVKALEIESGCVHLELFETAEGELVFLEIANRMGGAGVVNAHLGHTGIHLPSHEIAIRLGLERPAPAQPSGRYHGWLVVPGHHLGTRGHTITVPEAVRQHPAIDALHVLAPEQPLPDHITYHEWLVPVFIEASHADAGELAAFFRECARTITVEPAPAGG
ncbi:ATP-grasp domain-containing protein [Streptomyces sp. NPDC021096]|uniref:ATP-grasp domain-containing protein n=1 Tax=Streptomyces sp. NPDC021096 TaxID=3154792 RepID=UPI0033D3CB75